MRSTIFFVLFFSSFLQLKSDRYTTVHRCLWWMIFLWSEAYFVKNIIMSMSYCHIFFQWNLFPLFLITHSSSFSVIHVNVNIKNSIKKDMTLLLFFLSKSPGSHTVSFQIKPWVAFGLLYLLIELFYIGVPVGRMAGRMYGHVTMKISRMHCFPNFFTRGAPLHASCGKELRYHTWIVTHLILGQKYLFYLRLLRQVYSNFQLLIIKCFSQVLTMVNQYKNSPFYSYKLMETRLG